MGAVTAALATGVAANAVAIGVARGAEGPDPVIHLCEAFREIEDIFRERMQRSCEITKRVHAEMPLPDPSIVHGPESEALRIKKPDYPAWQPPHNAIEPRLIEDALFYIRPVAMRLTEEILPDGKIARTFVDLDEPEPLNEAQQTAHDRLTRMLELSKEYFAEIKRREEAAGETHSDDEVDELADRQCVIERALRITPAKTREGLLAKIELYQSNPERHEPCHDGDGLAASILRDTRRLLGAA